MTPIQIVTGGEPDALVTHAASELKRYISKLFQIDAAIVEAPGDADATARLDTAACDPPSDDQAFILRRDGDVMTAVGGSPKATMWAVYELVERWGVRYMLHGDSYPDDVGAFAWPDVDQTFTPNLRVRCWRLVNGFVLGPESWGIDEYRRFIDQAAKMKYNEVFLNFWPWQSFVHYEFNGVAKRTGTSFFGLDYPIDDDMIGREVLPDAEQFENPDLADITDYHQRHEAAVAHASAIMDHAMQRGMTVGMGVQVFEYPLEFLDALPGSKVASQLNRITCGPGSKDQTDYTMVNDLARTIISAYVKQYPQADYLYVGVPEHRDFLDEAPAAWERLDEKFGISEVMSLEEAIAGAEKRTLIHGGAERQVTRVKGDVIALDVLTTVFDDASILERPGCEPITVVYNSLVDELFPLVPKLAPAGRQLMAFIDYTARRVVDQIDAMDFAPTDRIGCRFVFTLADDNVGVLPQLATRPLHDIATRMRQSGWEGFTTRYWIIGDLDPSVHHLARSCWDASLAPEDSFRDLATRVCGETAADHLCRVWDIIETITDAFDRHGMGFAFPVPQMMLKHFERENELNDELREALAAYNDALEAAQAALQVTRPAGKEFVTYIVARMEFAIGYVRTADQVRSAGIAHRDGRDDQAAAHIEAALAALRPAMQAWADVVRDNCDRGSIAVMNRECYRPLRDKLKELRQPVS